MLQSCAVKEIRHNEIQQEAVSHDPDIAKKVILRNGDIPNITQISKTVLNPGQATSQHTHRDMTEIYTFRSGTAEFHVDGKISCIEGPATVVIEAGEVHSVVNISKSPLSFYYIGVLTSETCHD